MSRHEKKDSWKIFEKISRRYDLANRVISLGIDKSWRRKVSALIPKNKPTTLLDLATGTGDLLFAILNEHPNIIRAVGVDMSPNMLKEAERKALNQELYNQCSFRIGDATDLHFKANEWEHVTISFGIRNTSNTLVCLKEINRVLKKNGKAIVLEFSLPRNSIFKAFYLFYFRHILPVLGFIVSGKYKAYRYLNATVEEYPYGGDFVKLMEEAGFTKVSYQPQTFGIATIYVGEKH